MLHPLERRTAHGEDGPEPENQVFVVNAHGVSKPDTLFVMPQGVTLLTTCRRGVATVGPIDDWHRISTLDQVVLAEYSTCYSPGNLVNEVLLDFNLSFRVTDGFRHTWGGIIEWGKFKRQPMFPYYARSYPEHEVDYNFVKDKILGHNDDSVFPAEDLISNVGGRPVQKLVPLSDVVRRFQELAADRGRKILLILRSCRSEWPGGSAVPHVDYLENCGRYGNWSLRADSQPRGEPRPSTAQNPPKVWKEPSPSFDMVGVLQVLRARQQGVPEDYARRYDTLLARFEAHVADSTPFTYEDFCTVARVLDNEQPENWRLSPGYADGLHDRFEALLRRSQHLLDSPSRVRRSRRPPSPTSSSPSSPSSSSWSSSSSSTRHTTRGRRRQKRRRRV